MTFPKRIQDCPAYLHHKSNKGRIIYGEDIFVGYRYYETIDLPVQFPFGHGLSYTSFGQTGLQVHVSGPTLSVQLRLENIGGREGSEVVQVYISQRYSSVLRPQKELKGFAKYFLKPKEVTNVKIDIPVKYATSFWDESVNGWTSEAGIYDVSVGNSSQSDDFLQGKFQTSKTYSWNGL
jgi:beta-glucosidase